MKKFCGERKEVIERNEVIEKKEKEKEEVKTALYTDSSDHLISEHEHSLECEALPTKVEEVFHAWSEHLHHHHIEVT